MAYAQIPQEWLFPTRPHQKRAFGSALPSTNVAWNHHLPQLLARDCGGGSADPKGQLWCGSGSGKSSLWRALDESHFGPTVSGVSFWCVTYILLVRSRAWLIVSVKDQRRRGGRRRAKNYYKLPGAGQDRHHAKQGRTCKGWLPIGVRPVAVGSYQQRIVATAVEGSNV